MVTCVCTVATLFRRVLRITARIHEEAAEALHPGEKGRLTQLQKV